jgi:hypothetical protein
MRENESFKVWIELAKDKTFTSGSVQLLRNVQLTVVFRYLL